MDLGHLQYAQGAKKERKRVGRGIGSGHGKTSCRGQKGQKSRSGSKSRAWFEGGQMPLQRRVPKRGFTNIYRHEYQIVNLGDLDRLKEEKISPEKLFKARLIRKSNVKLKILGRGEVKRSLEVSAHAFSKSAIQKLESAGGKAILL
ncbi:50S ribosomal protein L15 [bacterium]|nr:50S ribosomal protein L15 [bacterium]